jgi:hypothetical protein
MKNFALAVLFLGLGSTAAWAQALIISQVVDGEVWQTTVVVTNTTAATAHLSLTCFQETAGNATIPWNLTFAETANPQSISLAAGQTLLLHTPGSSGAASPTVGWCQVVGDAGVVAYAIFTKRPAGLPAQVGTSSAVAAASRILVPFDNTNGNIAAMALVNASSALETISVNIRTTGGTVTQGTLSNIPPQGHIAFTFPLQFPSTAGQSGLAEFYIASGTFSALALNFNPAGSLTTAPVYNQSGPPIITGSGSAGSITSAGFSIGKLTSGAGFPPGTPGASELIGGQFASYSSAEWNLPYSAQTFGSCTVLNVSFGLGEVNPTLPDSFLDAGASIPVSGPGLPPGSVLTKVLLPTGPIYSLSPAPGTLALGGTYTLTGTGGTQVGPFTVSATLPDSFVVTNWDAITSINHANALPISWTGTGFDLVIISVQGFSFSGTTFNSVVVSCAVAGSLGTYTIPAAAMAMLPATANGSLSVTAGKSAGGTVSAVSNTSQSFTPPLVGGGSINYGSFAPFLGTSKTVAIQ